MSDADKPPFWPPPPDWDEPGWDEGTSQQRQRGVYAHVPVHRRFAARLNPLRWRKVTWVILVWNGLALFILAAAVTDNSDVKACRGGQTCVGLTETFKWIAVVVVVAVWLIGFLALLFAGFMTRPQRRLCPRCGKHGRPRRSCTKCGYDFTTGTNPTRA